VTRVLLIEDDPAIRNLVAYALSDEGYQVDEAADGLAALEIANRRHPDIIILDMKMPRMDGWQFARLYRERYDHQTPIIVVTAAQDAANRAADINSESYLAKPFELETLVERVAEVARKYPQVQGH
jgi:DNA-binding response OmpR family regulator